MSVWLDKAEHDCFSTADSLDYESSLDFLDWACTIEDVLGPIFAKIQELLDQKPVWQF